MRLELLDEEHGHDEEGVLYVKHPSGWRSADEPGPDAPLVLLGQITGDETRWYPVPHGTEVGLTMWSDRSELLIDGKRWAGPWKMLVDDEPLRRLYVELG